MFVCMMLGVQLVPQASPPARAQAAQAWQSLARRRLQPVDSTPTLAMSMVRIGYNMLLVYMTVVCTLVDKGLLQI